jgi:hypothetical protein
VLPGACSNSNYRIRNIESEFLSTFLYIFITLQCGGSEVFMTDVHKEEQREHGVFTFTVKTHTNMQNDYCDECRRSNPSTEELRASP